MKSAIAAGWFFAFVVCGGAFAADHSDDCTALLANTAVRDFALMRVTGTERVHFADCFAATCITEAYVVPGDLLIATPRPGDLVCTVFPNKRGGTKGWIPSGFLSPAPADNNPPLAAWAGKWRLHQDAEIEIRVEGGALAVKGQAFWMSGAPGAIHDGELSGKTKPNLGILKLRDPGDAAYSCAASLRLLGPYLAVQDNGYCGGQNVSFTGVYRRP